MLDKKRIDIAKKNIERYLREGLIKRVLQKNDNISNTLLKNSEESLTVADQLFTNNLSSLWVIVASYYSMYYIANAVLYHKGYKVGKEISHQITNEALIVFIKDNLKQQFIEGYQEAKEDAEEFARIESDKLLENFEREKEKRSKFQYETTEIIKRAKAETSLKRAKEFLFEMKKLILN